MSSRAQDGPQQKRVWTTVSTVLRLRNPGGVCVCVCVCVCVKVHSRGGAVGVPIVKFLELGDMKSRLASAQVPQLSKHLKD